MRFMQGCCIDQMKYATSINMNGLFLNILGVAYFNLDAIGELWFLLLISILLLCDTFFLPNMISGESIYPLIDCILYSNRTILHISLGLLAINKQGMLPYCNDITDFYSA